MAKEPQPTNRNAEGGAPRHVYDVVGDWVVSIDNRRKKGVLFDDRRAMLWKLKVQHHRCFCRKTYASRRKHGRRFSEKSCSVIGS